MFVRATRNCPRMAASSSESGIIDWSAIPLRTALASLDSLSRTVRMRESSRSRSRNTIDLQVSSSLRANATASSPSRPVCATMRCTRVWPSPAAR